jgi:hypothetical protein
MDMEIEGPIDDIEALVMDEDDEQLGDAAPAHSQTCLNCP